METRLVVDATTTSSHHQRRQQRRIIKEVMIHHGLAGLNEAILETGQQQLLITLQIITIYLESNPTDSVVIHCVQGKDR